MTSPIKEPIQTHNKYWEFFWLVERLKSFINGGFYVELTLNNHLMKKAQYEENELIKKECNDQFDYLKILVQLYNPYFQGFKN